MRNGVTAVCVRDEAKYAKVRPLGPAEFDRLQSITSTFTFGRIGCVQSGFAMQWSVETLQEK